MTKNMRQVIKALDAADGSAYMIMTSDDGREVLKVEVDAVALAIWYYEYLDTLQQPQRQNLPQKQAVV